MPNALGDPVHFDCPGPDLASDNILTFQHLWNLNNPADPIDNLLVSASLVARSTSLTYQRIPFDDQEAATLTLSDHCPSKLQLQGALR